MVQLIARGVMQEHEHDDSTDDGDLAPGWMCASLIGITESSFKRAYQDALVIRHSPSLAGLYSLVKVAELISAASKQTLSKFDVGSITSPKRAQMILAEAGHYASQPDLTRWVTEGRLTTYTVVKTQFYLAHEVQAWARQLSHDPLVGIVVDKRTTQEEDFEPDFKLVLPEQTNITSLSELEEAAANISNEQHEPEPEWTVPKITPDTANYRDAYAIESDRGYEPQKSPARLELDAEADRLAQKATMVGVPAHAGGGGGY